MPDARRTKVKGKQGIYFREVGGCRRYEITYLDSDGRRRWQTVPGLDNLDEAEHAVVEIKSKLNKGERVAPSRQSFAELSEEWKAQLSVAERTREHYERDLPLARPATFRTARAQDVTVDDVARLIAELEQSGLAGWTIRGVLTCLSSLYARAVRRGKVATNPVRGLERGERPAAEGREKRVLSREEIGKLVAAATPTYRPVLATAVFSGLRLMELLGLRWADVEFERGELHVRSQLSRKGTLVPLKTRSCKRDVVLMPELAAMLKRHRLASRHSRPEDFVFCGAAGRPLHFRNVQRRGMDEAVARARLEAGKRDPTMHDLRHCFASLLIGQGLDVVFVSRQLGHANPATTLRVYASEFDKTRHADAVRAVLSEQFGNLLETATRNQQQDPTSKTVVVASVRN